MTIKRAILFALMLGVPCSWVQAQSATEAQALVRRAAANAARAAQDTSRLFVYRANKETNSGTAVRDLVETKELILARTLTWNGRDLTPEERAKEYGKLALIANNADEFQKKKVDQDNDRRRTLDLVRALPDALIYQFDGSEVIHGREAIRLKFSPNHDFDPTTKETYGLKAASGRLWIDKEQTQIVRMEAVLTENVYIGWGILGHINKGGHLELEQTMLPGNAWRISKLNIEATGKAFFFKTINIKQKQSAWDYRPVPANLSVTQAIDLLKRTESTATAQRATP